LIVPLLLPKLGSLVPPRQFGEAKLSLKAEAAKPH